MQTHQLKARSHRKRSVQVGRGGTRGKTSGRGTKGQNARAGHKKRPELRDIIKTLPKLRGRGVNIFKSFQGPVSAVNLDMIEKHFKAGDAITVEMLIGKGLVERYKGKNPRVKILSSGDITKKFTFAKMVLSAGAKAKIEKAGGSVK
jgi:large subunit ribosomal protein L15